jgi:hypothetical protein
VFSDDETQDLDEQISAIVLPEGQRPEYAGRRMIDVHHLIAHVMARDDVFVTSDNHMVRERIRQRLDSEAGIVSNATGSRRPSHWSSPRQPATVTGQPSVILQGRESVRLTSITCLPSGDIWLLNPRAGALALQATKRGRRGVAFQPQDTNGRQTLMAWHGVHGRVTPFSCSANLRFLSP